MITNFKIFETIDIENVRCNNCWWYGYDEYGDRFDLDDKNDEICPNCGSAGMLSDNTPVDLEEYPDFLEYMKNNKPKEGILKNDYEKNSNPSDLEEYYVDAYPEYFKLHNTLRKYNI